ncbi:MAG: tetratricopeptide repeat protein [Comamonas sp.]|uniref:tetratricopeptide repeat protein n=1 Tax=Comamonas sp. TaxID=34028 RepID=UPI002FC90883
MPVRNLFSTAARMAVVAVMLTAGSAYADDYSDVAQLLKSGKTQQALQKADTYLAKNARDPQMRFLRGIALTNDGKTEDAITAFRLLTEDYPELPEPYNNLAVIYARQGDLDRARSALEAAVRNNPNYAVAHENLGDIYARLAYQSYAQSLAKGGRPAALNPKLKQLKDMLQPAASVAAPAAGPAAAQPTQPAQR